jgi:serine/threonine-protein kinase
MKRRLIIFLAMIAGLVLMYYSFEWAMGGVIHSRSTVPVPDLTGKNVSSALAQLSRSHLGLMKEGEQFDQRFPTGVIIRQNPPGGMLVREGRIIKITLSQGGETQYVPDLLGQPLRDAQTALQNAGLSIGDIERRPSLKFAKEQIITTDPPANAVIAKSGLVNLTVSDGPPASDVQLAPDFIGKPAEEAQRWAEKHHLNVTVQNGMDALKGSGVVLSQVPEPDTAMSPANGFIIVINSAGSQEGGHVHFQVPEGNEERDIKVVVIDETGEREVFRHAQAPGSVIDFSVNAKGHARARVFVNGILAAEQNIQ